jgi:hypothetical protein
MSPFIRHGVRSGDLNSQFSAGIGGRPLKMPASGQSATENTGIWSIRSPVGYRNATEGRIEFKRQEINRWLKSWAISLPAW